MTLNHVKPGRAVTFMKCLALVASLIFLPETLFWIMTMLPASDSLNFAELVVNEFVRSTS